MASDGMLHSVHFCGIWWLQHIHEVYNSSKDAISSALRAAQAYIRGLGGGWVGGGSWFEPLGLVSKINLSTPPPCCRNTEISWGSESVIEKIHAM